MKPDSFGRALLLGLGVPAIGAAAVVAALWAGLEPPEREKLGEIASGHIEMVATVGLLALVAFGIWIHVLYGRYVERARAIADDVMLIAGPNPAHRVAATGPGALRQVASAANRLADRLAEAEDRARTGARMAVAAVSEERNRLAALMSELAQCVLVCNSDGRILLYNDAALTLLDAATESAGVPTSRVGLGRSVFTIIDRDRLLHAQERIVERLAAGESHPVARFVTVSAEGRFLRAQMAPVVGVGGVQGGHVILLEDATREVEAAAASDALLRSLTEDSRASLASIVAAGETLGDYPDMDSKSQRAFIGIINEEATRLGAHVDRVAAAYGALQSRYARSEEIVGADLLRLAARRIETATGAQVHVATTEAPPPWLNVASYELVAALVALARHVCGDLDAAELALDLTPAGSFAHLDLSWDGKEASVEQLEAWEAEPLWPGATSGGLRAFVEGQGGDAWLVSGEAQPRYRIVLPLAAESAASPAAPRRAGRPEFYDFDLFHQPGQSPELDNRRLEELAYTVFDTETTGLDPSRGDEIISIGAVRIVNGRLLTGETFDQLVDPQRAISAGSLAVHGIDAARLDGQPTASVVLPRFHSFCRDTVLVGHNAAFDMRFLQVKEPVTGVRFDHAVLDTLLLSAVIHPQHPDHALEAIAARLGVEVAGRHTAMGDAILTAQVFLRMVPLLAERGIVTLGEARAAAERTLYARLVY